MNDPLLDELVKRERELHAQWIGAHWAIQAHHYEKTLYKLSSLNIRDGDLVEIDFEDGPSNVFFAGIEVHCESWKIMYYDQIKSGKPSKQINWCGLWAADHIRKVLE